MYRQGDVLLKEIDVIDINSCETVDRDEHDRIVLAHGEVTGHSHAIHSKNSFLMKDKESDKVYLMIVKKEAELVHEEHTTIILPIGNYEVIRQREYRPEREQYVQD